MIELTKLNGAKLVVNSDMIEYIEVLPDSLVTLTTGMKIMVKEGIPEIINAIIDFRRRIHHTGYRPANHRTISGNQSTSKAIQEIEKPPEKPQA
jgi:flagellar protein FlbD